VGGVGGKEGKGKIKLSPAHAVMAYRGCSRVPTNRFSVLKHANLVRRTSAQRIKQMGYTIRVHKERTVKRMTE
jgi:hypothetical protein